MQTEIKTIDGRECLVIVMPLQQPALSSSGKTLIVASSYGTKKSTAVIHNKTVSFTASAWIKPD